MGSSSPEFPFTGLWGFFRSSRTSCPVYLSIATEGRICQPGGEGSQDNSIYFPNKTVTARAKKAQKEREKRAFPLKTYSPYAALAVKKF
jgi:hypothetical protein